MISLSSLFDESQITGSTSFRKEGREGREKEREGERKERKATPEE